MDEATKQAIIEGGKKGGRIAAQRHYETPEYKRKLETVKRMRAEGYSVSQMAAAVGVSKRNMMKFITKHVR